VPQRFRTTAADAAWRVPIADRVAITPRVTYRRHIPWQTPEPRFDALFYDKTADRLSAKVTFEAERGGVSLVGGGEAYRERAWLDQPDVVQLDFGGRAHASFTNVAAFGELGWDAPVANLLVGGRVERHSTAGSSFVPRVALTKLWHPLHLKLLYAGAFRAPAIENVSYNDTRPERTRVLEAEAGYAIGDSAYVGVNAFDVHLDGPIVYSADPQSGLETYRNYGRTGSRGIEAELRLTGRRHAVTLQYAFYTAAGRNRVDLYEVPGHDELTLGFAAHRATLLARFAAGDRLSIAPSLTVTSARYAYRDAGAPVALPGAALFNVFASWRDAFTPGLEIGVGLYDLLGAGVTYPQPYAAGHAPLPGPGREILAKLSWEPRR
jgi:hypothetical protein